MSSPLVVRGSVPADRPGVAALLDRSFGPMPFPTRQRLWDWRSHSNPARPKDFPEFLIADLDGEVVGVHGLLPLRVQVGADVLVAACSCDFAVRPEVRGSGMKLKLGAMSAELSELPLSTSANEAANRITVALGGKELGSARATYIKLLRLTRLLRRQLDAMPRAQKVPLKGALTAAMGAIANPILGFGRRLRSVRPPAGTEIVSMTSFDERFDRLWERFAARGPVAVVRDAAYLNWRYAAYPFQGIQSLALQKGGEVLGFAALHRTTDEDGIPIAVLLDLFADPAQPGVSRALLHEVVQRSARGGAQYLSAKASDPDLHDLLASQRFIVRTGERSPYTYKANRPGTAELLDDPAKWYIGFGDGDAAFYPGPERTSDPAPAAPPAREMEPH